MSLKLYSYYRSTASYRVRIALNLKGLAYQYQGVRGLRKGEPEFTERYLALNPQGLVPLLVDGDVPISQSLAIIEYLDELHPEPPLLPREPAARAHVRGIALYVACDVHPLNIMRVRKYLTQPLGHSQEEKMEWYRHWAVTGFEALERMLERSPHRGTCCHGDTPTLADLCLVPQVYNAERFKLPLDAYPTLKRIHDHCMTLPAFIAAQPHLQPDVSEYAPNEEY
ncbi:maleylacetoacetate isomerase [Corallococcus exercitus]|uniref:maleylacetoacetate isomerase n=1 Tax=Corallococcus exercitus TaxID=2316736 RepID=UPI0035D4FBD4